MISGQSIDMITDEYFPFGTQTLGKIKDSNGNCLSVVLNAVGERIKLQTCTIDETNENQLFYTQMNYNYGYTLLYTGNSTYHLTNNGDIPTLTNSFGTNDYFIFQNTGDNGFLIKNIQISDNDGIINESQSKCLQVIGNSTAGYQLNFETCNGDLNQLFYINYTYSSDQIFDPIKSLYNDNSIPLTTNAFLDSQNILAPNSVIRGWSKFVSGITFSFNNSCILTVERPVSRTTVYRNGNYASSVYSQLLWNNIASSPIGCSSTAYLKIDLNGNLCTFVDDNTTIPNWCSQSNDLGGRFFNILPFGSYGYNFGITIQDNNGKMVWGKWGNQLYLKSINNIIPGSFLDNKKLTNNKLSIGEFITNGRDYLMVKKDTGLTYYIGNPNNAGSIIAWSSHSISLPALDINSNSTLKFIINSDGSSNLIKDNTTILYNSNITGRYIHIPILNQDDISSWGWFIQSPSTAIIKTTPSNLVLPIFQCCQGWSNTFY